MSLTLPYQSRSFVPFLCRYPDCRPHTSKLAAHAILIAASRRVGGCLETDEALEAIRNSCAIRAGRHVVLGRVHRRGGNAESRRVEGVELGSADRGHGIGRGRHSGQRIVFPGDDQGDVQVDGFVGLAGSDGGEDGELLVAIRVCAGERRVRGLGKDLVLNWISGAVVVEVFSAAVGQRDEDGKG